MNERKPYASDEEWAFIAPYLLLLPEDVSQRRSSLREVSNGLRWVVRTGASCCRMTATLATDVSTDTPLAHH